MGTDQEPRMRNDRNLWEFWLDADEKIRWRTFDVNGLQLAMSSQGYKDKRDAEKCAARHGWNEEISETEYNL